MNLFKTAPYRKVPFKIVPHRKEHGAGLLRVPSIPVQRGHISSVVLPPHSQPGENGQKTVKAPVVMVLGFCWHLQRENSYYNGIPYSPDSARILDLHLLLFLTWEWEHLPEEEKDEMSWGKSGLYLRALWDSLSQGKQWEQKVEN